MSTNYDNWERLVRVVLRREHDRQLALSHSRDVSSISSTSSSFGSNSRFDSDSRLAQSALPMDYSDLTLDHRAWKAMLPPDEHELVYRSASMSFFLDSTTGKNCFLLGSGKLVFDYSLMENHWKSRFFEVGTTMLQGLDIRVRIGMQTLSPDTLYATYLVFEFAENNDKLLFHASSIIRILHNNSFDCDDNDAVFEGYYSRWQQHNKVLSELSEDRADGWKEIQLGDFYVDEFHLGELVEVRILNVVGPMWDLVVEGIEFRPLETPASQFFKIGR